MTAFKTGMIRSLRLVYKNHGGIPGVLRSGYFWISIVIAVFSWTSVRSESWKTVAMSSLPTLAGFSVAAYAILFAVLDERARKALSAPDPALQNRSPLLMIVSSVTHAVIVQIITLIYAFCFEQKSLPMLTNCVKSSEVNLVFSSLGLFMFIYSVTLVLASVLSIFTILDIRTRV